MMRDILQIFSPNKEFINAKSLICGQVELDLIVQMNQSSKADCDYFFNGHRIETRTEIKQLLRNQYNSKKTLSLFHEYSISVNMSEKDFEFSPEAFSYYTQSLAQFLNIYDELTIKAFNQCFHMMENKYGWYNFSLDHFLEFWSIAEINNIPNSRIGDRLRQWQELKKTSRLAS